MAKLKPWSEEDFDRAERRWASNPQVTKYLPPVGIDGLETLYALEIIPPGLTKEIGKTAGYHTLESPKLSHRAAKAFYVGSFANVDTVISPLMRDLPISAGKQKHTGIGW